MIGLDFKQFMAGLKSQLASGTVLLLKRIKQCLMYCLFA